MDKRAESFFMELARIGGLSDEHARVCLDTLEKQAISTTRIGRVVNKAKDVARLDQFEEKMRQGASRATGAIKDKYQHAADQAYHRTERLDAGNTLKLGAVSDEQARRSLDRLEALEANKPSVNQVARYAGLGAVAGPAIRLAGNVIKKKPLTDFGHAAGASPLRGVLGDSVAGALSGGAVPLLRNQLDRRAEMGTLKRYVRQPIGSVAAPGTPGSE